MAPTKIQGSEYTIGRIFSNDFAFQIADYQRPYAWGVDQARELIEDLLTALSESTGSVDTSNPYFLGSIVLIKGDDPDAEVVDGQQRLTTLTLLLAAIRSLVPQPFITAISKLLYQEGDPITGRPNNYRLLPRTRDRDFFASSFRMKAASSN